MIFILKSDPSVKKKETIITEEPAEEDSRNPVLHPTARQPLRSKECKFLNSKRQSALYSEPAMRFDPLTEFGLNELEVSWKRKVNNLDGKSSRKPYSECGNIQTTTDLLPNTARSSSNGLVKVKLGFVPPPSGGEEIPISIHTSTLKDEAVSKVSIRLEPVDQQSEKLISKKTLQVKLSLKPSLSHRSSYSSKPQFTFTRQSGSNSGITSKKKGESISSKRPVGHRIDSAIDFNELLSKNQDLTEYMRQKEAKELFRLKKEVRYKRINNDSGLMSSIDKQSVASPPTKKKAFFPLQF